MPKFISVRINNKSSAAVKAKHKAEHTWISETIKSLYRKVSVLTSQVYYSHLLISKTLHRLEYENVIQKIETMTEKVLAKRRRTIKQKLRRLIAQQRPAQKVRVQNNEQIQINHEFYHRVHNMTDITFNNQEQELLDKGLKFNIAPSNNSTQTTRQLLDIENAIRRTDEQHQDDIRTLIAIDIRKNKTNINQNIHEAERHTVKNINTKLLDNNALITKADKGNTLVIMKTDDYNSKINDYIENNNIIELHEDPTNKYHKTINKKINNCSELFNPIQKRRLKPIKPTAPKIRALPKIHKPEMTIRPIIDFTTAPSYKVAKEVNYFLNKNIQIQNDHSIKNNIELVNKIESIDIPPTAKLASFDITNMYTNIPTQETIQITKELLQKNGIKKEKIDEIITLITTITEQNYFQHNNKFYSQTDGLPMGNPLSGTLANIYMNHFENQHILTKTNNKNQIIKYWHRYVDDIIILFNGTTRQLSNFHKNINNKHPNIKFTLESETNKSINFLDLTITNVNNRHTFKIYRKDTQTDHAIDKSSNHPYQHKMAAFNFLINRLNTIPMNNHDYTEELKIIKHIAIKNGYNIDLIDKMNNRHIWKKQQTMMTTLKKQNEQTEKYITVEYNNNTNKNVTKVFKKHGYTMAFKTNHKLGNRLKQRNVNIPIDTGIYKNTCNDCAKFYIGQTGRSFEVRFTEHIKEIGKPKIESKYAQHLTTEKHNYTDINTNSQVLHRIRKGPLMNRLEELEIYKERHNPLLLNEKIGRNKIYDIITNL